jgi:uncharacterized protein YndB with AHSA1/START domain
MPTRTHATASRVVDVSADDAFHALTDIAHLPDWNAAISLVIHQPARLTVGAEWVVEMHALGRTWQSRSVAETIDAVERCFAYRSRTDDDNPSYALWTWVVTDHPDGALVTVACEMHPRSFWRRVLFSRLRSYQLRRRELPRSLADLDHAAAATRTTPRDTTDRGAP